MDGDIKRSENFIAKFIRGGYSLGMSFWGFGLCIFAALYLAGWIAGSALAHSQHLVKPVFFVICLVELILKFMLVVGIWNSGKYYRGPAIWTWCARLIAILLFALTLFFYAALFGV